MRLHRQRSILILNMACSTNSFAPQTVRASHHSSSRHWHRETFDEVSEAKLIAKLEDPWVHFDARIFNVRDEVEVMNNFIWRCLFDCRRNSISSLAHSVFSTKQLHKVKHLCLSVFVHFFLFNLFSSLAHSVFSTHKVSRNDVTSIVSSLVHSVFSTKQLHKVRNICREPVFVQFSTCFISLFIACAQRVFNKTVAQGTICDLRLRLLKNR